MTDKNNNTLTYQKPKLIELELLVDEGKGWSGDEPDPPAPEQPDDDNDSFGDRIGDALGM